MGKEMMDMRWKIFDFIYRIQKEDSRCARSYSELIFLGHAKTELDEK